MDAYTPKYGIIDYKKIEWRHWNEEGCGYYGIKPYSINLTKQTDKFKNDTNRWFIYKYEKTWKITTQLENTLWTETHIIESYVDNYLNDWSQTIVQDPICRKCPKHYISNFENYNKCKLDSPLSNDIIDKIKKEWTLHSTDIPINVIRTYVKLYMETKALKEELCLARLPPPKKPVDEEIAELQTRIMKLYAEKNKN